MNVFPVDSGAIIDNLNGDMGAVPVDPARFDVYNALFLMLDRLVGVVEQIHQDLNQPVP